jgi:acetyltransferase-like isoleucine patch superfamily enzyme
LGVPKSVIYKSDFPDGKLIGKPIQIGAFSVIDYGGNVKIGKNVKIGYGVTILSVSTITGSKDEKIIKKPVIVGDNVEIGSNAVILPGVTIGNSSTIGAGAVVVENIPPNSIAVGVPAKVIKEKTLK